MLDLSRFRETVRSEGGLNRRLFLAWGAALSSLPLVGRNGTAMESRPQFSADPFSLGVASGDPNSSSVVLWTRLAPEPLVPGGGMDGRSVRVDWEVAEDESFDKIVARGHAVATEQLGHSVHAEASGLKADRWYWYRFRAGDAQSPIGRTRTMPACDALPERLKFAVTSCQHYEAGLFTAYEQMARDEVDLVFQLGDYIYENAGRSGKVRMHLGQEIQSLDDYRVRHAQYRSDALLSGMHAQCPWMVTWDDHELDNNYAGDISEKEGVDPVEFLARRASAYQAYYEMMPLRPQSVPTGPSMQLYRNCSFGRLAEFMVLDTRQYRTDQPNNDKRSPLNEAALATTGTMLGAKQKGWLCQQLVQSPATWNVMAQQVMMGMVGHGPGYSMDQWPGYAHERIELLKFIAQRRVSNPVVLTGDIHSNWANELRVDDRRSEEPVVATEFVATSLSSGGNGVDQPKGLGQLKAQNPCVKFHNAERGYVLCTVTASDWRSDYMVVDDVLQPGGKTFSRAAFVVEAGDPHVKDA